jgi:hypothetical protein
MARKKRTTLNGYPRARTECFMLCDYARAENGKLYIVGGGWDQIAPRRLPLDYQAYLAVKVVLQWEIPADPVSIVVRAELLDQNDRVLGEPVFVTTLEGGPLEDAPPYLPEEFEGQGRLVMALFLANEAKMTLTEPGRFTLRLLVNDEPIATTEFTVTPPREATHETT